MCQKVLRIEQIPLSILTLKWMGIDCEGLSWDQDAPRILKGSEWTCANCHSKLMVVSIDPAGGVIHMENAIMMGNFGCPEFIASRGDERPAALLPIRQIGRLQHRKGPALGRQRAGPISI